MLMPRSPPHPLHRLQLAAAVVALSPGARADEPGLEDRHRRRRPDRRHAGVALGCEGHEVLLSSRHPEALRELARSSAPGPGGTPQEAAAFGEVVLVSVPYKALPQLAGTSRKSSPARSCSTPEPLPERDGEMAWRRAGRAPGWRRPSTCPACAWCAPSTPSATQPGERVRPRRRAVAIPSPATTPRPWRSPRAWSGRGLRAGGRGRLSRRGSSTWARRSTPSSSAQELRARLGL